MTAHPTTNDPEPFIGARPYRGAERGLLFGREREIGMVIGAWRRHRVTLVSGAAGVGKTSILLAGAIPRLCADGLRVLPVGRIAHRPAFPAAALSGQNPHVFALLTSWFPDESPTRIAGRSMAEVLRRQAGPARAGRQGALLVAVDRAELVFGGPPEHQARLAAEFGRVLAECPSVHLLFAVRQERRSELAALAAQLTADGRAPDGRAPDGPAVDGPEPDGPAWDRAALNRYAEVEIGPLDGPAALAAVSGPLVACGRPVPQQAAARLVEELRTVRPAAGPSRIAADVDPALLQLVCSRLWPELVGGIQDGRLATEVDRVLAEHCAQVLGTVAAEHSLWPRELLDRVRAAFVPGAPDALEAPDGPNAGNGLDRPGAEPLPPAVLRALEDHHLIWPARGAERYRLRHPRLAAPLRGLGEQPAVPGRARQPGAVDRLRAAELAICRDEAELARYHAEAAIRACGPADARTLAEAECFRGDLAYEQGDMTAAAKCYERAASLYESLQDTTAVGWLLTAIGRLKLDHSPVDAVRELGAAAARLPNDPLVQTGLAQALWHTGQSSAALAVLDGVLSLDGTAPEALRCRGEIYSDLGQADSALRDLNRIDHDAWPSTRAAWALAQVTRSPAAALKVDLQALDRAVAGESGNGPVLLRVARVRRLCGNPPAAAGLAARAVRARRPPLPPQLRNEAEELLNGAVSVQFKPTQIS